MSARVCFVEKPSMANRLRATRILLYSGVMLAVIGASYVHWHSGRPELVSLPGVHEIERMTAELYDTTDFFWNPGSARVRNSPGRSRSYPQRTHARSEGENVGFDKRRCSRANKYRHKEWGDEERCFFRLWQERVDLFCQWVVLYARRRIQAVCHPR